MLTSTAGTFSLIDLFQWLDQSHQSGVVVIDRFQVRIVDRRVVAASSPPSLQLAGWVPFPETELAAEASFDRLTDVFMAPQDTPFSFGEPSRNGTGDLEEVPLSLTVMEAVLEGLRCRDEWPRLDAQYQNDGATLRALSGHARNPGLVAVHAAARQGLTLAETRLCLGLSRPALLRRVETLRKSGLVTVAGAAQLASDDALGTLLTQAQMLLAEKQFDEATLVIKSVLATDPFSIRARLLYSEAQALELETLRAEIAPTVVPIHSGRRSDADARRLSAAEQQMLAQIDGQQTVQALLLGLPLQDLALLNILRKLSKLGLIDLLD